MALRRRVIEEQGTCGDDEAYCSPPPKPPSPPAPASPPSAVIRPSAISPPPILSPPATKIQISNKNHVLAPVVVVVTSVLGACLLILAFCAAHRYWSSRRRRRETVALAAAWGPPQPPTDAEGDLLREDLLVGGGGGGEEPYHVWYIRTVGLDQAVIGAITVCEYRKGEELVEGTDCAVCLGEFGEGELLRLLPKCSHAFHVPCIDTWLRSHVNCPLCRAPVVGPALACTPPPLPSPAVEGGNLGAEVVVVPPSNRQDTAGEDSGVAEDSVCRMASGDGSAEDCGNSTILQPGHVGVDRRAAGASFSSEESETWVSIDLGSGGLGDETDPYAAAAAPPEEGDGDSALQPVRRSVSMDSSAMLGLLLRTRLAGSSRDGGRKPGVTNKKGRKGEGNNCKGGWVLDAPPPLLEMERSMSGGRFFLSRARGGILPL